VVLAQQVITAMEMLIKVCARLGHTLPAEQVMVVPPAAQEELHHSIQLVKPPVWTAQQAIFAQH